MVERILNLIESKREGIYWDFKEQFYTNNSDLLHDILCFSNTIYKGNKYIILGVTDPRGGCEIRGLEGPRKVQADIIDLIRSLPFAADNRPEIEMHSMEVKGKIIDVIEIFETNSKPYYLTKDYQGIKAYHIYSRNGDTNTPKDKSSDYHLVEKMWRQKFGLDVSPSERFLTILLEKDNWQIDVGNKREAYYIPAPEYRILFSEPEEGYEVYSYFFPNERSFFGIASLQYLTTTLFEVEYGYLDEFRIPIAVPKISSVSFIEPYYYYYFIEDSLQYKLFSLIGLNAFLMSRKKEYLPFIFYANGKEKEKFENYVKSKKNIEAEIHGADKSDYIGERMRKDGHDKGNEPRFLSFIVKEYYFWKEAGCPTTAST